MSWPGLLELIREEVGDEAASRIEDRARLELGGLRIYIKRSREITREELDSLAPGKPRDAARKLGIHPATAYRILQRDRIIR